MNQHIEQLKDITAHLAPSLSDFVTGDAPCRVYLTIKGRLVGVHLYSDPEMAVARMMATAGTELGPHQHMNELEVLGVLTGRVVYNLTYQDGRTETKEVKAQDVIVIPAGVVHSCVYPELTLQWALTMPPAPGFPLPSMGI